MRRTIPPHTYTYTFRCIATALSDKFLFLVLGFYSVFLDGKLYPVLKFCTYHIYAVHRVTLPFPLL